MDGHVGEGVHVGLSAKADGEVGLEHGLVPAGEGAASICRGELRCCQPPTNTHEISMKHTLLAQVPYPPPPQDPAEADSEVGFEHGLLLEGKTRRASEN